MVKLVSFGALTALAAALVVAAVASAAPASRDVSAVHAMVAGLPTVEGDTALVRNDNGAAASVHASGLVPGTVATVWWVVFNNPAACTWGAQPFGPNGFGGDGVFRCALGDVLFNALALPSVQFAAGHVIGGSGEADYGGYLGEGDTDGCASPALPCNGLLDSRTADVHLVIRTHGPAIPGLVDEQLGTFNGGCLAGEPNVGMCKNLFGSAHEVAG